MTVSTHGLALKHRYIAAEDINSPMTLLLLHGTGGDENDMLPLGISIAPNANLLSPRGNVLENGMTRYFRRISEGVFDIEDLKIRTKELAEFVENASSSYGFDLSNTVAVGYSNGANMAASLLLLFPRLLAGAILFRPIAPIEPETQPDLTDIPILISSGKSDTTCTPDQPERLFRILLKANANVTISWHDTGHGLIDEEIIQARDWLQTTFSI